MVRGPMCYLVANAAVGDDDSRLREQKEGSVLQCVAGVLQVCCSVLQCVAVCCVCVACVLQCVAVCCSVLPCCQRHRG